MQDIFNAAVQYGKEKDGYINLVKDANIVGFMKVANDTVPKKCVSFKIQNFEKVKTKN